jgi:hypothetical protein
MTHDDFKALVHYARTRSEKVMDEKGIKYSSEKDRLSAFKEAAEYQDHCPEKELFGYLSKHMAALNNLIRKTNINGYVPTLENLLEVTGDISNYMDLLNGLYVERMRLKVSGLKG